MNEKLSIRREMRRRRSDISPDIKRSWDLALTDNLLGSEFLSEADCVYCFCSTDEEPDTTELIQALLLSGRKVACPRVEKGNINFYYISSLTDCCPGFQGICEPLEGCRRAEDKEALVILPGLAFSIKGERIGYGGGYYDRFLAAEPAHTTAALAYSFQVSESLPCDDNDLRTEYIVTPEKILKTDTQIFEQGETHDRT